MIPVDLVVAAILAVAADGPATRSGTARRRPRGLRRPEPAPLRAARRAGPRTGSSSTPSTTTEGQPIVGARLVVPRPRPGAAPAARGPPRRWTLAERVVASLPIRGRQAEWLAALEEQHLLADRALGYVELYGAYAETEARYRVDRLLALWDRMDDDDRRRFCLDPAGDRLGPLRPRGPPALGHRARPGADLARRGSRQADRADRARKAILSPDRHLAAFDLENTLIASNVVDSYAWLASPPPARRPKRAGFVADLVREAPSLLALDRRDRGDFLRSFYRRYEGAPVDRLRADAWELFHRPAARQVVPGRHRPGPRAPRASATAPC